MDSPQSIHTFEYMESVTCLPRRLMALFNGCRADRGGADLLRPVVEIPLKPYAFHNFATIAAYAIPTLNPSRAAQRG